MGRAQPTALPLELRTLLAGLSQASVADNQQWMLALLRQHGESVVHLLWRILGAEHDVLDAYQTAVCQLTVQGKDAVRSNPGGYFYRTAMNAAIAILRRRKQERLHERTAGEFQVHTRSEAEHYTTEQVLDQQLVLDRLRQAVLGLPPHLRDVIVLRDLAELPYAQVATIIGITVGTARLYRCKAVLRLAELIEEEMTP